MNKKVIYEVMFMVDAYMSRDWFENECFAIQCSEERDGKERIVNKFVVTKEFLEDNNICFSDSEYYTEAEIEQLEATLGEEKVWC
tara:strand:- start:185 stop:439 length:255 start_codon:yes stop_codon:yes gene_type:complete